MITILCVGKTRDAYLAEGVQHFVKRIQPFASLEIIELKDEKGSDAQCVGREGARIIEKLEHIKDSFIIACDERGKSMSSIKFARFLNDLQLDHKNIVFIIGGASGLSKAVRDKAHYIMAISRMTFTHQMIRLFLLEQIYRAFMINENRNYHK